MANINLLQNQLQSDNNLKFRRLIDKLEIVLFVALVLAVLAGVGLFIWNQNARRSQANATQEIEQSKVRLAESVQTKRDLVIIKQAQLRFIGELLASHVYWPNVLDLISSAVVPGVQFSQMTSAAGGTILINGLAPDFTTIASFTKQLNSKPGVSQVILNSSSLSNSQGKSVYNFTITVAFDPEILKKTEEKK